MFSHFITLTAGRSDHNRFEKPVEFASIIADLRLIQNNNVELANPLRTLKKLSADELSTQFHSVFVLAEREFSKQPV